MQTELFFLQTIPQNTRSTLKNDDLESWAQDESSRAGFTCAKGAQAENHFQSTLEKISPGQSKSGYSHSYDRSQSSESEKCGPVSKSKHGDDGKARLSQNMVTGNSFTHDNDNDGALKSSSIEDLAAFGKLFGLDMPSLSVGVTNAEDTPSVLKSQISGLQMPASNPSTESINEHIRYNRHFAQMTMGADSGSTEVKSEDGQDLSQMLGQTENSQKSISNVRTLNAHRSQINLSHYEISQRTAVDSSGKMGDIIQEGPSEKIEAAKPEPETSSTNTQIAKLAAVTKSGGKSDAFQIDGVLNDKKGMTGRGRTAENLVGPDHTVLQNGRFEKESTLPKMNSDVRAGVENVTQRLSGEEPFSKVFNASQTPQDPDLKIDKTFGDDQGIKVTKADTPTNDNGSLNSHHQSFDKVAETSSSSKSMESSHRDLGPQTIDQIVRKASMQLRNGYNEANIELKPEYLGHLRMQVSTENHQVTVRILVEHPFVKEMIENNLHQLKADLQQQGLDVDELEVSVSDHHEGHDHTHKHENQIKSQDQKVNKQKSDIAEEDERRESQNAATHRNLAVTVDYFA